MSEINCLIDVNNSSQNFMITMDSEVSWETFNEEIRKYVNLSDVSQLKFSYFDEAGDKIRFASEIELKEAFNYAESLGDTIFVIFVESEPLPFPSSIPPQPEINEEKKEEKKEERKEERSPLSVLESILSDIPECNKIIEGLFGEEVGQTLLPNILSLLSDPSNQQKISDFLPSIQNLHSFLPLLLPLINKLHHFNNNINNINNNNNHNNNHNNNNYNHKEERKEVHQAICDNCNKTIEGVRYKCLQCFDFDFCEECEQLHQQSNNSLHNENHIFAKINKPLSSPFPSFPSHLRRNFFAPSHFPPQFPLQFPPPHCMNKDKDDKCKNNNNHCSDEKERRKKCPFFSGRYNGFGGFHCRGRKVVNPTDNNNDGNNYHAAEKENEKCKRKENHFEKFHFGRKYHLLQQKVDLLEQELNQIKLHLQKENNSPLNPINNNINNDNVNNDKANKDLVSPASLEVNFPPSIPSVHSQEENVPVANNIPINQNEGDVKVNSEEEECLRQLQEMGFDVHRSLIVENNCDLSLIIEKLI